MGQDIAIGRGDTIPEPTWQITPPVPGAVYELMIFRPLGASTRFRSDDTSPIVTAVDDESASTVTWAIPSPFSAGLPLGNGCRYTLRYYLGSAIEYVAAGILSVVEGPITASTIIVPPYVTAAYVEALLESVVAAVAAEEARAKAAEDELADGLTTEEARAKAAEDEIADDLTVERTDRIATLAAIAADISETADGVASLGLARQAKQAAILIAALAADISASAKGAVQAGLARLSHQTALLGAELERSRRFPTASLPAYVYDSATGANAVLFDGIIRAYPVMTQSVGDNATDGEYISTTSRFPTQALMPTTGTGAPNLHPNGANTAGVMGAYEAPGSEVPDSADHPGFFNASQSICTPFLDHLVNRLNNEFPGNAMRFITWDAGKGSTPYAGLRRGSQPYLWLMATAAQLQRYYSSIGLEFEMPGILFWGGQSDAVSNPDRYREMVWQAQRQVSEDFSRIKGSPRQVMFHLCITGYSQFELSNSGRAQRLQQSMLAAADHPYVRATGPDYAFERHRDDSNTQIHYTANGSVSGGMMAARSVYNEEYAIGQKPMRIMDAYFSSPTTIDIELFVPVEPVVLDTTTVTPTVIAKYGFDVWDLLGNRQTVNDVAILVASTTAALQRPTLRLTLASAPTVQEVDLGCAQTMDPTTNQSADGPTIGARTNFRDSVIDTCLYDGHSEYNWLCPDFRRLVCYA